MANFVILFALSTHKNTHHTYIFIIFPHTFHKHLASMHSAEMNFWGNDANQTLITNINHMPELVGFSNDFAQGPAVSYQASQTDDSDNELKLMMQNMQNEMDRKLDTVVEMMGSRNDEVIRHISLLCEKIDGLSVRVNNQELASGGMCLGQPSGMVHIDGTYDLMNKGKEKMLMSPGLYYSDGALRLSNTPTGDLDQSQDLVERELLNAQELCLFSEQAMGVTAEEGASANEKPCGEACVDGALTSSPGLSGYEFVDTEDFTQYY